MLLPEEEALHTDAYIDALLAGHAGVPVALPDAPHLPDPAIRRAIALLEAGLPRIHPSFRFEQQLAARLRLAALAHIAGDQRRAHIAGDQRLSGTAGDGPAAPIFVLPGQAGGLPLPALDRRLLVGGAIASGVSLAGAAMIAWRLRERARPRRGWLA
jgi:hypothetical protein